jgi:hypothetical protein
MKIAVIRGLDPANLDGQVKPGHDELVARYRAICIGAGI